jgi:cell division protein YceG involved in septum cleavage
MASYLEGEANNEKDMRIVSGVLWTRLKLNYPLQIDAATTTYKIKGMTKNPINNPGLVALRSAIDSINTGNIYYITGNDGKMYYAKDYKTHLENINKYLRN